MQQYTDANNLKQGSISALFPNLGMDIIHHGCTCKIVGVKPQQLQVEIITIPKSSMYKIGNVIWVDSFLIFK